MGRLLSNLLPKGGVVYADVDEALVKNGLDWTLSKHPTYAKMPDPNSPGGVHGHGVFKRVPNLYSVVRNDTGKPFASVGVTSRYEIKSNFEVFAPLKPLAKAGGLHVVGANSLDDGKFVWVHLKAPKDLSIGGDLIKPYILALTRHDGKGDISIVDAPERFSCTNQLRAMLASALFEIHIRHTAVAGIKLKEAEEMVAKLNEGFKEFERISNRLLNQAFSVREMENLVKTLIPRPDAEDPDTTDRMLKNWDHKFETIMKTTYQRPDLNNIRPTKLGALNCIADYEQHDVRVKGTDQKKNETLFRHAYLNGALTKQAATILLSKN